MGPTSKSLSANATVTKPLWAGSLLLAAGHSLLAFGLQRHQTTLLIIAFALATSGYMLLASTGARFTRQQLLGLLALALALRVLYMLSMPVLSDDYARFVWDGRLLLQGQDPFAHLPGWYLQPGNGVPGLTPELYGQLNSPQYFTIYPPIAQFTFWLGALVFPNSLWGHITVMRVLLLAAEISTLWLLWHLLTHWRLPRHHVLWYALNPLAVAEVVGNLHHEGLVLCFVLWALWLGIGGFRWLLAAGAFGLAVASKLLPLVVLPLLFKPLGFVRAFRFQVAVGACVLLLFVPFLGTALLEGMQNSVGLYFQRFEFNASVYYVVRWLGYQVEGYNIIGQAGPALALCTLLSVTAYAVFYKVQRADNITGSGGRADALKGSTNSAKVWATRAFVENKIIWPAAFMWAWGLYILFATTVHPWYSIPLLGFSVFTRYRWPVVFSVLSTLSYWGYSATGYTENLWLTGVEYGVTLAIILVELRRRAVHF